MSPEQPETERSDAGEPATAAGEDVRAQLLASGWRQGSVLPPELARLVQPVLGGYHPPDGVWPSTRYYIVVSQDCDICSADFQQEPTVEVVLAKKIKALKGRWEHLRTPRALHVALTRADGSVLPVEVDVRYRGHLPHELLRTHAPDAGVAAVDAAVTEIAMLVSRRYLRGTRPDAFDARWAPLRTRIEEVLDRGAREKVLYDILLRIEPLSELTPDEAYAVTAYGVLTDAFDAKDKSETRAQIDALQAELTDILMACDGIDVELVEVVGRRQINLQQHEGLRSFEIVWPRLAADADADEDDNDG